MLLFNNGHAAAKIAVQHKYQADRKTNDDAYQQIREHNGKHRDRKRNKLCASAFGHLHEQLWTCQFESRGHQNGRQRCKWNMVEQRGK